MPQINLFEGGLTVSLRGGRGPGGDDAAEPAPGEAASHRTASMAGVGPCAPQDFSADELLSLVGAGSDWVWETDSELRFSWLSGNYRDVTGIAPEDVLGRFRFDFLKQVSRDRASAAAHLADLEARRPFRDFVYELRGGKADCRWISITGYPRFEPGGAFAGYRGVARNVTSVAASLEDLEAPRREPAGHEERGTVRMDTPAGGSHGERMMAALNVMKDAFCYYDSEDRLVLYNEAMLELYRGLADEIRPGVSYERLLDLGLERGLWDMNGLDPAIWRLEALARRAEPQWQTTFRTAEGRWIMHREMRTDDGGAMSFSTDVTDLNERQEEAAHATETARLVVSDLERTLDSLSMGVVLLDGALHAQIINKAFYDIWRVGPADVAVGSPFRALMDINRHNGIYDVPDEQWEGYVASRLAEIRAGDVAPREFARADGCTMIYSVTALSGGKRLVCYYDITEMKNREAEIATANGKTSELLANLRRMVDSMSIGIIVLDSDLRTEIINQAFYDLWTIGRSEIAEGATFRDLMEASRQIDAHGVDAAEWEAHIQYRETELRAGLAVSRELERSDGRAMICNMAPLSGGKLLVSYVDVTEMKNREAELAEALEKARLAEAVINGVTEPIFVKDQDLRFVLVNESFSRLFGLKPQAMVDKVAANFTTPDEASGFEATERAVLDTGEAYEVSEDFEFQGIGKSRVVRKNRVGTASGKTYVAGFLFDVTEIKRRETEAEDAQRRLTDILERMPAGVLIYDSNDRFLYANRELQDSLPGLAPIWKPGVTLREAFEYGHSIGYFRRSGIDEVDALYDVDKERWIEGIHARYHVRNFTCERMNPNGRWYQVRDMRLEDGSFIGVRVDITELKEREKALRDSMGQIDLLRHTLDDLPVAAFIKSRDLRIEYVNKAWSGITGISKDEAVGRTDMELFDISEADGYAQGDAEVSRTGKQIETEEPVVHRDGTLRQLMTRKSRLVASDGTVHLVGSSTDITDMKEREKALRDTMSQLELLRHTLDELPVTAFIKSKDLRIEYVNKAWSTVTGVAKEDAIGRTDLEMFKASDVAVYNACDQRVLDTGETVEMEEPIAHVDGSVRQFMTRKNRLTAVDGTVHIVASCTDITDMKLREHQLGESLRENEVFRGLIDNVPVAIYAKRPDLTMFYVNKGWCDLTGFTREDAIGRTDAEIFGPEGEVLMEGDRSVLRTMSKQEIPETVTAADGSLQYQIARKGVMTATDGSLYLIGSTTDITELKERERELEEAQRKAVLADRAKSEFLANMSHEIRTPMNGVLGMAELLAKSELNPKQKMFTDIIVKSGNALLTIINDILDFSKIDAGQMVLDIAPFNLAEAIEDVATLVSTRAKEKDLEMIVRVEQKCQEMFLGDAGRVRQIITNLLGNAVKFTDSGHVLVEVTGEKLAGQTRLKISVTDTGIGIPAEKLRLVFEKFSQVDSTSTRRHEGTGLGLAITSRLVDLMGGEIGVESVEGQGSTFWFSVTLQNAGAPEGRRPPPLDVTGARVLVIDDNAVNRAILSEQMDSWTFDSCAAESGPEGIRVLEAAAAFGVAVDCVILDYQMPGMTGADVARVIRSTPGIADTPIVMLTSVDQTLSNLSYRNIGIEAQLIKPARSSALLDTLITTIQKHRSASGATLPLAARYEENAPRAMDVKPAAQAPAPDNVAETAPVRSGPLAADHHRIDILVAEDNEVNQLVFTQILAETPYSFEIVGNGRLAVEAFGEMNPRMILMDVSMPEMNGIEATAAIRAAEGSSLSHVPIVGVTAHALKGDRERCLEAGMDDYLPKPISPKTLLEKVERWAGPVSTRQRSAG
jgi:PAS domain S-box-containing protein